MRKGYTYVCVVMNVEEKVLLCMTKVYFVSQESMFVGYC